MRSPHSLEGYNGNNHSRRGSLLQTYYLSTCRDGDGIKRGNRIPERKVGTKTCDTTSRRNAVSVMDGSNSRDSPVQHLDSCASSLGNDPSNNCFVCINLDLCIQENHPYIRTTK